VPLPGPKEIEQLLQLTLSAVTLAGPIDWHRAVDQLSGASAAMVVKMAQDAAKAALLAGQKAVTDSSLQRAIAELKKHDDLSRQE
jgi:ATP-dependent 26S proteasome regulatory subunit